MSATANSCRVPDSLERTNQGAPGPMWHSTHPTREWADSLKAAYSGAITEWHVTPQNSVESMYFTPWYDAALRMATFRNVAAPTRARALCQMAWRRSIGG